MDQNAEYERLGDLPLPSEKIDSHAREAQNALRAAVESAGSAIANGITMNRLDKTSRGVALQGGWKGPAQDSLRAAVLFAGAGVDRTLKQLVEDTMPVLVASDEDVESKLRAFANKQITDAGGAVDARRLVDLLLLRGEDPRQRFLTAWVRDLTNASAQSADRVQEIASAVGVTEPDIRKRVSPTSNKSSRLERAFTARNEIAHELDVTNPEAASRQRLERIRRARTVTDVREHCTEMLAVAQLIVNDVVDRIELAV